MATAAVKFQAKAFLLPLAFTPRATPLPGKIIRPVSCMLLSQRPPGLRFRVETTMRGAFFIQQRKFSGNFNA
ncbi:hypothetical protein [Rhizobium terrae]|uniref:hypothetical protein n=1 Tax=Rhizobium terrae TaxID=2171756 RepID=UPI0013C37489|nr:hypothetical protein [Rhizobium terrae]